MPVECAGLAPGSSDYVTQSTAEYRNLFKGAKVHQLCGDISPDYPYYHRNAVPKSLMKSMCRRPSLSFCAIPSTGRIRITCTMCGTGGSGSSLHPLKKWSLRQIRGSSAIYPVRPENPAVRVRLRSSNCDLTPPWADRKDGTGHGQGRLLSSDLTRWLSARADGMTCRQGETPIAVVSIR